MEWQKKKKVKPKFSIEIIQFLKQKKKLEKKKWIEPWNLIYSQKEDN